VEAVCSAIAELDEYYDLTPIEQIRQSSRHEGNYKDNKRSGWGTFYYANGSQEKQNWKDGKNVW